MNRKEIIAVAGVTSFYLMVLSMSAAVILGIWGMETAAKVAITAASTAGVSFLTVILLDSA